MGTLLMYMEIMQRFRCSVVCKVLIWILSLGLVTPLSRADEQFVAKELRAELKDKILILRGLYSGSKLRFDLNGTLLGTQTRGYWSSDGMVRISDVSFDKKTRILRLSCKRIVNVFDNEKGLFSNVLTDLSLRIELESDRAMDDVNAVRRTLATIVSSNPGDLNESVPDYWSCWVTGKPRRLQNGKWSCSSPAASVAGTNTKSPAESALGNGSSTPELQRPEMVSIDGVDVYRVHSNVRPPHPTYTPDPSYTPAAKDARVQGITVLWAVINETGNVQKVMIERPLGAGLDDKAVEIVRTWRFDPATKNGKPVAVQINIEVNFRLY